MCWQRHGERVLLVFYGRHPGDRRPVIVLSLAAAVAVQVAQRLRAGKADFSLSY